ncbi:hypothetical protein DFJ74DRAFT_266093 [Hyaloraphidium curvatum]|nr:hypothetical protein DFJ74DRAFT_266093 [Hyaloraphidium curvatum]
MSSQQGQEKYKPTEHGGLKEDGTPDKRVKGQESEAHAANAEELAHGSHHSSKVQSKEDPSKSGAQVGGEKGGSSEKYKPTEHGGMKEDGTPDKRVKGQESGAHARNTEKLAHGSHHSSKIQSKEGQLPSSLPGRELKIGTAQQTPARLPPRRAERKAVAPPEVAADLAMSNFQKSIALPLDRYRVVSLCLLAGSCNRLFPVASSFELPILPTHFHGRL